MDFEFSDDQKMIQQQVREVLDDLSSPQQVRSVLDTDKAYHEGLWAQAGQLGWTATRIPEQYGGLGLGYLELAVIAEELGRSLAPTPFSSSIYFAAEALLLAGNGTQKQHYLPKLAAGEIIGCLAMTEQQGAFATAKQSCTAKGTILSGCKLPVSDGDIADFAIVSAMGEQGCSLYLVDLHSQGVQRETLKTIDPSRSQARLSFDKVNAELLGEPGQGEALLNQLLDIAAVLFAFEQVGGSQAALDMGMEYTKNRYAFGRQVASFQAIKHKFADMYTALELARSNAYYGAWALSCTESGMTSKELPLAAATARVSATDAFYLCSKENVQSHGGMGFTWEFDCHLYYRRAQLLSLIIGGQPHWKNCLVDRLMASEEAA
ncbi:MAG: acyl-CoA dehydrogenase family protein [Pseudomonadales bacterium]